MENIQKINDELLRLNLVLDLDGINIEIKWITIIPDEKTWFFPRHMHESYEFHVITKGKCTVMIEGKMFSAKAGEFYIISPGKYHSQASDINDIAIEYGLNCTISITPTNKELYAVLDLLNNIEIDTIKDDHNLANIFERIVQEISEKKPGYYFYIKLLIYEFIIGALRSVALTSNKRIDISTVNRDFDQIRVIWIEAILSSNLSTNLSLKELSKLIFLSERQINRIMKRITGQTCHQYIINFKINKAKELLANLELKISRIAEELGFSNQYHFSNTFKKITGYWPTQYRRILLEEGSLQSKTPTDTVGV